MQLAPQGLVREASDQPSASLSERQLSCIEVAQAPAKRYRLVQFGPRFDLDDTVPCTPAKCGPQAAAGRVLGEREVEIVVVDHVSGCVTVDLVESAQCDAVLAGSAVGVWVGLDTGGGHGLGAVLVLEI